MSSAVSTDSSFCPTPSSGGSEAKALHNAAQKALAGEIAARATRLGEAPDAQLVLAADGAIRWTGAAVGKLFAGEDVLHPRVRLIADEHLTGAPRDAAQARLDQWLKSHIEKLLGPLFELSAAADVTGIARGVAFQLVEALGVLDRQKVAEEVKGLQQPERASLRKYGVRFGAYHIYVPALLKPVPRALAAQLWALSHDGHAGQGARRFAASCRQRPHFDSGQSRDRCGPLSHGRISGLRRTRRARRHPGAARRFDTPGACLARRRHRDRNPQLLSPAAVSPSSTA